MGSDPNALLLERDAELEAVEAALTAAAAGSGRLVLVEGPAGKGKTALLAAARHRARRAGIRVLAARGSELERDVPFGLALELFGRPLQAARPADRQALFRGAAELAAPLFSAAPPAEEATGQPSSFPVVHGLYWLLANLAEGSPHLVTVDDAHWADPSSLRFLLYLAERLEGLPLALLIALRPEDAPAGGKAMARLRGVPHGRVLHLQPLSKDASAELTRRLYFPDADDGFCRAVFDASGGNPFIVREVLQAADLEGLAPVAASAERVPRLAPESIVRATRLRIGQLPPDAGTLAQAAAVLGPDAQLRHTARLAGLDPRAAATAAHELVAAGLLRSGEPLDFAHPPVRSAVYTGIPPGRRAAFHADAAALLDEDDAHPERLATHLLQSHATGDARVVELVQAAARRALAMGAPELAVRYLNRALAEPPPAADRAGLLVELGRIGAMVGDPAAVGHLRRAVQLLPDGPARGEALHEVGRALVNGGRYGEATEALRQGLEEAGRGPSELRRRLLAALLQATRLRPGSRERDLIDTAESAVDGQGGPTPSPTPGLRALFGELAFEWLLAGGRFDEVRSAAHRALAGLEEAPADEGAHELPFYNAVAALTWADDLEVAEESLDRALAEAERRGRLMAVATASFRRATVNYLRGSLAAAVADAQRAVDASAQGWAAYLPAARGILALALLELGELPRAAAALERGEGTDAAGSPTAAIFFHARATLHLVEGAAAEALDDALTAGRIMTEDLDSLTPAIVPWRSLAATAHHQLGAAGEARRLAAEEVDLARQFGAPRALGVALRVQGVVEGGARGLERLQEAAAVLAGSPARLEHARALADLGAALRRAGRPEAEAGEALRRGLELAERCGATILADRLSEELTAAGLRPPRRSRRSPVALTPGEARVAQLAAGGLTNKAVAQQLFVSVRAVEFHLGNVYTKLGISSRRQLAGALASVSG